MRPLQVRWWEAVLTVPLLLLILLFLVARDFVAAVVLVAVGTLLILWRAEIVERNAAGGYLRIRGWVHVDHLVLAPNIAFAIETKTGRESAAGRRQALGNAAWAKEQYNRSWVNAVLCVLTDPPTAPKKVGQAWVTGVDELPALIERLSGTHVPR